MKLGRGAKLKSSTIQKIITTPGLMLIIGVLNNIIGPLLAASEDKKTTMMMIGLVMLSDRAISACPSWHYVC